VAVGWKRPRQLPDEELIKRMSAGDVAAFETLFERHAAVAFSLAQRICMRRAMAEDVTQEVFLWLWRDGARYDPNRGSVRSWLLTTVHNRSIDALRRAKGRDGGELTAAVVERLAGPELTEPDVLRRDEARRIRDALGELPAEQRRVIVLAYFGGFTHHEISSMLGLAPGTVKGRMRLGLQKLRDAVGEGASLTVV
jgi:RNA polymerase sigma-70 factor (ECF subfamily)